MRIAPLLLITGLAALAQTPAFDVASVKQSAPAGGKADPAGSFRPEPNALTVRNASLLSCIAWAYAVDEYQVSGPDWLSNGRFDIDAKAGAPIPETQLRQMLQGLLKDRFKLEFHRDQKDLPVYALTQGKGGAKLDAAKAEGKSYTIDGGALIFRGYSPTDWAAWASVGQTFGTDRPVVDQTGLTGRYDFRMQLFDSIVELKMSLRQQKDPSFYSEPLKALGLKLEPQKAPREVLLIDRAEKVPTRN